MSETTVIDTSEAVTLSAAAREFGQSEATLRRWVREGHLPAFRFRAGGPWRVMPTDLVDLIEHSPPRTHRRTR